MMRDRDDDAFDFEQFYRDNEDRLLRLCRGYLESHPSWGLDVESVFASCRRRLFVEFKNRGRVGVSDESLGLHLWRTVRSRASGKSEKAKLRIKTIHLDHEPAIEQKPASDEVSEERVEELLKAIDSTTERAIARRLASNEEPYDIADSLGLSRSGIHSRIGKVRRALAAAIRKRDEQ